MSLIVVGGVVLAFVVVALIVQTFRKHKIPVKGGPVYPKQPQK